MAHSANVYLSPSPTPIPRPACGDVLSPLETSMGRIASLTFPIEKIDQGLFII